MLERLTQAHEAAVLAFERQNRAYFARSISDRGDEFFRRFGQQHRRQLDEQRAGTCAYYVLALDGGVIAGRFNLYDLADGTASVGYRVAERVAGRGVATAALRELCTLARDELSLTRLTAVTSLTNAASQRVLVKAAFVNDGTAEVAGRPGLSFMRIL